MPSNRVMLEVEVYVHVFAEAARIIISIRFCIPETFQDAIRLQ